MDLDFLFCRNKTVMDNQSVYPNGTKNQQENTALINAHTKVILYCIVLVWSLLGNVLVIAVVRCNENLRTNFNYLIVNMAISDLFIPALSLPMKIVEEMSGMPSKWFVDGPLGNALCKLCYFLSDISPAVSVFSLVIIAANRLFAIVFPVQAQKFGKKKGWILISLTWIIAMALFSTNLYTFQLQKLNNNPSCLLVWPTAVDYRTIFFSVVIIVEFFIPFVAITVMYSFLLFKVHHVSKRVNNMLNNQQARSRHRKNRQIFYISIAIVVVFAVFWGPFFCFFFVVNFIWRWTLPIGEIEKVLNILFVVQFLGYLNSAVNPCIYFLFLKNYRQGLKKLFRHKRGLRSNSDSQIFYMRTRRSTGFTTTGNCIEDPCKLVQIKSTTSIM
jgi:hypothetical protein